VKTLTADTLAFARATFGPEDLPHILATADSDEVDTLLDLIYYPDADLQHRYEERWGAVAFDRETQHSILVEVNAAPMVGIMRPHEAASAITIPLPHWIAEQFIQRLNITWQPVASIAQRIERCLPSELRIQTRVHLRNAGRREPPHQADLLGELIEKTASSDQHDLPCLLFLVSILPEFEPHQSPFDFLISKKEFYFQALCKAEDFERRRQGSNMEILMLQGARAAHGSAAQWRHQMQMIDRICRALFGHTRYLSQPRDVHIDIRRSDAGWDMDDVLRSL
jgi:hypothetical protein